MRQDVCDNSYIYIHSCKYKTFIKRFVLYFVAISFSYFNLLSNKQNTILPLQLKNEKKVSLTFVCVGDMVQEGKQESRTFLCVSVKEKKNRVHLFVLALGTVYY